MRRLLRYLIYVLRHMWFVLVAGLRVGPPLWRLVVRDWSKFLTSKPRTAEWYDTPGRFRVGGLRKAYMAGRASAGGRTDNACAEADWQYWLAGSCRERRSRWREAEPSRSGKLQWVCEVCGRLSQTPDKLCPAGCADPPVERVEQEGSNG